MERFRVVIDSNGCDKCGHDKQWAVVYTDTNGDEAQATSMTYGDEEDADAIAAALNFAYGLGSGER